MVVKIIIEMVRMRLAGQEGGVGSLIRDLEEPAESVLFRMDIVGEPKNAKQRGVQAVETFKNYIEVRLSNNLVVLHDSSFIRLTERSTPSNIQYKYILLNF
jgi:hypothetical protein